MRVKSKIEIDVEFNIDSYEIHCNELEPKSVSIGTINVLSDLETTILDQCEEDIETAISEKRDEIETEFKLNLAGVW